MGMSIGRSGLKCPVLVLPLLNIYWAVQRQLMLRRSSRSEKPAREIAFDERGYRVHRDAFECEPSRAANTREAFD